MGEDSIKLLSFWSSPFALRVRLGLELKGLKYELQEEDMLNRKSELLLQSNPVYKKVPVLIHNGRPICESSIILQYIDEVWPNKGPSFLPQDPSERAEVRFWADFADKKFISLDSAGFRAATSTGDEKQKAVEELNESWAILEGYLNQKKKKKSEETGQFFGGKEMNLVDLMLSYVSWYAPAFAQAGVQYPDHESCPRLHQWIEAVEECPQVQLVFPDKQKLEEHMMKLFALMKNAAPK